MEVVKELWNENFDKSALEKAWISCHVIHIDITSSFAGWDKTHFDTQGGAHHPLKTSYPSTLTSEFHPFKYSPSPALLTCPLIYQLHSSSFLVRQTCFWQSRSLCDTSRRHGRSVKRDNFLNHSYWICLCTFKYCWLCSGNLLSDICSCSGILFIRIRLLFLEIVAA